MHTGDGRQGTGLRRQLSRPIAGGLAGRPGDAGSTPARRYHPTDAGLRAALAGRLPTPRWPEGGLAVSPRTDAPPEPLTPADALRRALAELADAAVALPLYHLRLVDRVAVVLCRAGCRSRVAGPDCPVAVWLARRLGLAPVGRVVGTRVLVTGPGRKTPVEPRAVLLTRGRVIAAAELPAAVAGFLRAFDGYSYPELIADY